MNACPVCDVEIDEDDTFCEDHEPSIFCAACNREGTNREWHWSTIIGSKATLHFCPACTKSGAWYAATDTERDAWNAWALTTKDWTEEARRAAAHALPTDPFAGINGEKV